MIRLRDALTLARTKMKTHRVRTGVTVAISAILFGLILSVIIISQGAFDSVRRFSDQGVINDRTILDITHQDNFYSLFSPYDHVNDPAFIKEVQTRYDTLVAMKKAAAKKYSVPYDPAIDDQSPIGIDPVTKQKTITEYGISSPIVAQLTQEKQLAAIKPFDINTVLKPYKSAKIIGMISPVGPNTGQLNYMKDGKEDLHPQSDPSVNQNNQDNTLSMTKWPQSLLDPFIVNQSFDPSKGEVPVLVPYSAAQKALGLKPLPKNASNEAKLQRLREVRNRVGEITFSFCYRNAVATDLLQNAIAQSDEIKTNQANKNYIKPPLIYQLPNATSCGPVTIAQDRRTADEQKQAANQQLFDKAVGNYLGEPDQRKVIARGVGVFLGIGDSDYSTIEGAIYILLTPTLGDSAELLIPDGLFSQLPEVDRPAAIFDPTTSPESILQPQSYAVEFGDKNEARTLYNDLSNDANFINGSPELTAIQLGSNILLLEQIQRTLNQMLLWTIIVVSAVAVIILTGIVARTVSDGRKESAVFRAIGAKRLDIASIYGIYTLLLAFSIAIFATILSLMVALSADVILSPSATVIAKLAYMSPDTLAQFHFISVTTPLVPLVLGVIILASIVAATWPIIRNSRRNPINDMREE